MKKLHNILAIIFSIVLLGSLLGCNQNEKLNVGDPYTVTFVDYDGSILKTIDCTYGETCTIEAPSTPDSKPDAYFVRWSVFEDHFDEIDQTTTIKAIYTLDNVAFSIFGRDVVFYSLFIMSGIAIALLLGLREAKRTGVKQDDLIDGFLWIVPVSILGARLW